MSKPPTQFLTLETLRKLFDPPRAFYRPAVDDILQRGELVEIEQLITAAKDAKAHYGDFDKLIAKLEDAAKKVQR
jgi:hypothetical protein